MPSHATFLFLLLLQFLFSLIAIPFESQAVHWLLLYHCLHIYFVLLSAFFIYFPRLYDKNQFYSILFFLFCWLFCLITISDARIFFECFMPRSRLCLCVSVHFFPYYGRFYVKGVYIVTHKLYSLPVRFCCVPLLLPAINFSLIFLPYLGQSLS